MPRQANKTSILTETLLLLATFVFVWFWKENSVLSVYNLQLTGFFVIAYFIARIFFIKKEDPLASRLLLDAVILTATLLLVLTSTGGLLSPLFFLLYFFLFAAGLLFEPIVTSVITIGFLIFFVKEISSVASGLQALSLILISPLAIYFGKTYLRLLESQEKIKIYFKAGRKLTEEKKKVETQILKEETNSLLWLSLDFKDSLLKIIHFTAELLTDIGHLNLGQREILQKIHSAAKDVLKSGEKLKEKIDKETDQ